MEAGSLEKAREYVNRVRERAARPSTWVQTPDANYVIGLYNMPWTGNGKECSTI